MISFWGEEKIKELDNKAHLFKRNIDLGIHPKYPPEKWFNERIELLRNELKKQK